MSVDILQNSVLFVSQFIEGDQFFLMNWISTFLGFILNILFNFVRFLTINNSLGLSIILFTIVARTLMLPIAFKQQKSMVSMRIVQPEMDKIREKYGDTQDPELQRKMSMEMQELYKKNKVNPLSGCLPMFITLPIFIALSYLMRHNYKYVTEIGGIYESIAALLQEVNVITNNPDALFNMLVDIIAPKIQAGKEIFIDPGSVQDLSRAFNVFKADDWALLAERVTAVAPEIWTDIEGLLENKLLIENFFGISLVERSGWSFPGILIPLLSGATTFLSQWIIMRQQPSSDPKQQSTQKIMLIAMPIMFMWTTSSFSAGVGLYWIVSNMYHAVQQVALNSYYKKHSDAIVIPANEKKKQKEIIEIGNMPKNKRGQKK